jgi:choline dehydrogenase-like flavoprotein
MIEDARRIPSGTSLEADVCVVGAGPAGIALAREFVGSHYTVAVVESGGWRPDRATQSMLKGEAPEYWPLDHVRLSCLGGTTRVWSGWCRPLEPTVFEPRGWLNSDGWPFGRSELDPYYERAHGVCGLGPYDYRVDSWEEPGASRLQLPEDLVETALFHISRTRFGSAYRSELESAQNVRVLLNAAASELLVAESGGRVSRLEVRTQAGRSFQVAARCFILAAGGIENARLLLISDRTCDGGLGNAHGLVGRYFTEHLYVNSGRLELPVDRPEMRFYWPHDVSTEQRRGRVRAVFKLPLQTVEAERLLNCATFVLPPFENRATVSSSGAAAVQEIGAAVHRGWVSDDLGQNLAAFTRDPLGGLNAAFRRALLRQGTPREVQLRSYVEPLPNGDSRVSLLRDTDRLGRRRVRLDWIPAELEWRSIERLHELLEEAVRRAKLGRVYSFSPEDRPSREGGKHHMGTTRMHARSTRGVVDGDSRVHGIENLYVAGSSVFPTADFANPTLTIVALALRLADHVKGRLAAGAERSEVEGTPP